MRTIINRMLAGVWVMTLVWCTGNVGWAQPQYSTNFFTTVSPSVIPFLSTTNNKVQWLFLNNDFASAPSGNITRVYFRRNFSMLPVISSYTNLQIKMGQTTLTTLPPGPWITTGMNTVFQANTYDFLQVPVDWMPVTLQTPFYYDNTKNFIIEVSHGGYSVGFEVMQANLIARSLYGSSISPLANSQDALCDFGFDIGVGGTDATLEGFSNLGDTLCGGPTPVTVNIKNNGPAALSSVTVNWRINNIPQPQAYWNGSLPVNGTATLNLGNYNFSPGLSYTVTAWTSNPNNQPDLNPANDTSSLHVSEVMPAPTATPYSTNYSLCSGDSLSIGGTLTGSPPWHLSLSDGTNVYQIHNIITPAYSIWVKPAVNKTYTMVALTDISGCPGIPAAPMVVNVHPNPSVSLGPDQTIRLSDSLLLNAGNGAASYIWSTGATTQTITLNGSSYGAGIHPFSVTITNIYGCQGSDTVLVTVIDDTGVEEPVITGYKLCPNPSDGMLRIYLDGYPAGEYLVEIFSQDGRPGYRVTHFIGQNNDQIHLDLSNLPDGMYLLRIIGEETAGYGKILIDR